MARNITVIPAKEKKTATNAPLATSHIRLAAYCRVSTDQEDQLHSFEAQVQYYTDYIESHKEYDLAGIYADEGISGTNTRKRKDFQRLIQDCEDGKIDLVITKSISRFARNTQDCLTYSRKLKALGIGIIFEKEHINTLDASGELLFTILSSLAQDESRNISENCKWGIRSKFKKGEMHIDASTFLGYDKDDNGKLVINEEQAPIIRRIYDEFLWGKNPQQIAADLERDGIKTGRGNTKWHTTTVISILTNEKHKGDALLQKTYTADFLTKRQVKNHGEVTQYYVTDSHEGIIDKETWSAVQEELQRRTDYMEKHHLQKYSYGDAWSPFIGRVYCGKCGDSYGRHSWKTRNRVQWQCKNHRDSGVLTCDNRHVFESDLEKGFVLAFNAIYSDKDAFIKAKEEQVATGSPLTKVRARQMIELIGQPPLEGFIPEMAQLIIDEVIILGAKEYKFRFLDGTVKKMKV